MKALLCRGAEAPEYWSRGKYRNSIYLISHKPKYCYPQALYLHGFDFVRAVFTGFLS